MQMRDEAEDNYNGDDNGDEDHDDDDGDDNDDDGDHGHWTSPHYPCHRTQDDDDGFDYGRDILKEVTYEHLITLPYY